MMGFRRNFSINILITNTIFLYALLSADKNEIIFFVIHSVSIVYLAILINCHLFFLKNLTLKNSQNHVVLLKNKKIYSKYKLNNILTDKSRSAYVFGNNFILFAGVASFVMSKKEIKEFENISENFSTISENNLSKIILKNRYFSSGLIAFLIGTLNYIFLAVFEYAV